MHRTDCKQHVKKAKVTAGRVAEEDATIKELEHQVHQARRRKRIENKKQMVQKVFECVSAERTRENDLWRNGGSDARAYAQNVRGYSKER